MPDYDDSESIDMADLGVAIPRLVPAFGVRPHTPHGRCPCGKRGYRLGQVFCCMGCHRSGQDHRAYFRGVKPLPADPKAPAIESAAKPERPKTRKEKRAAKFTNRNPDRKAG